MGEAKRRGTYDERVAEGVEKRAERERLRIEGDRVRRIAYRRLGKSRLSGLLAAAVVLATPPTKEPTP